MNNEQPDLYMYCEECKSLDDLRDSLSLWANHNKHCVFHSHSVALIGMTYLLTIVYSNVED